MNNADKQYLDISEDILANGRDSDNRTDTWTRKLFGDAQMSFDLREGLPLLTTKFVPIRAIIHELLWFLSGSTNIKYLTDNNVKIWNEWADKDGELGPVYGAQWRNREDVKIVSDDQYKNEEYSTWLGQAGYELEGYLTHTGDTTDQEDSYVFRRNIDQIAECLHQLKTDPNNRRIIVDAWNPSVLPDTVKAMDTEERLQHYLISESKRLAESRPEISIEKHYENAEIDFHKSLDEGSEKLTIKEALCYANAPTERPRRPNEMPKLGLQALAACHTMFQFGTSPMSALERSVLFGKMNPDAKNLANESEILEAFYMKEDQYIHGDKGDLFIEGNDHDIHEFLDTHDVPKYFLDLKMYQRSADWAVGVPFNTASYSILQMMIAQQVNMVARNFYHSFGDYHIYNNHFEGIKVQHKRREEAKALPKLIIAKRNGLESYTIDDFKLEGYEHLGTIPFEIAV